MSTVGIIAEYSPFHNGHLYQLEQAKKITNSKYCVVIMSGNFVQRGEPAIVDKWTRAKMALQNGADLVIELPVHFSTSSAEFFSYASVKLLNDLGIIDYLCFGSEVGDTDYLYKIASVLCHEPSTFKIELNKYLNDGYSFATARSQALINYLTNNNVIDLPKQDILSIIKSPNNILGIEYLKALIKLNSSIKPFTIKRSGSSYHDQAMSISLSSATSIRKFLGDDSNDLSKLANCMPKSSYNLLIESINNKFAPVYIDDYSMVINYILKSSLSDDLQNYLDVSEGIENRFIKAITSYNTINEIINYSKTRRYPISRIQRTLIHMLLTISKEDFSTFVLNGYSQYVKILGFRKESQNLLKSIKQKCDLPIISNVKDSMKVLNELQLKMLQDEIRCSDIYNIALGSKYSTIAKNDYTKSIIIE
jgi:predicted nucleotidyltransferase